MYRPSLRAIVTASSCLTLGLGAALAPVANADGETSFKRLSTTPAYANSADIMQASVAEISTVSPDGNTLFYTDAGGGVIGKLDITDPSNPKPLGQLEVGGEPTSVFAIEGYVLVVVDSSESFKNPSGHVSVLDANSFQEIRRIDLNGQPDSIDVHGKLAVIAMENERDEEAMNDRGDGKTGDLPQAPAGELVVIKLDGKPAAWTKSEISLTGLEGVVEPTDPEPEYVKFSPDGAKIAVTLQENNAVVIVDAKTLQVISSWSAGEATVNDVDTKKDGEINLTGTVTAPREPDAIGWIDNDHVATANEGDWKGGTRGWTVFSALSGDVVWDAGNTFEYQGIENGHWLDKRASKKGAEPEGLAVETFDGVRYAFVGSERANYVNVYDVTNPAAPEYLQMLPTTNGPEGILPIPERNLLAISSEEDEPGSPMRATVALYELSAGKAVYPQITSDSIDGKPIPWLALGALAASEEPGKLYTASDNALAPNHIYSVDATKAPAVITSALPVIKNGEPTSYDIEGLYALPGGEGFWLGVEGDGKESPNLMVRVDAKGEVKEEIALPAEITQKIGKWGIEGITADPKNKSVYVAIQRDLDKSAPTQIVKYDVASGKFTSFNYELEKTDVAGDWMGLSEITFIEETPAGVRLAVIERDKGTGPDAKIKRIYEVTIANNQKAGDILDKTLVHDVLPDLQATNGWTQEKLEGMTLDAAGNVYIATDNDGLDDINGETVFLNLGQLFGDAKFNEKPGKNDPKPGKPEPKPTKDPEKPGKDNNADKPGKGQDKPKPGLPKTGA